MGVIQHGIYRPFPGEPDVPHPQEIVQKEEPEMPNYPEGRCEKCHEIKRIIARKLCTKCCFQERKKGRAEGTWDQPIKSQRVKSETKPEPAHKAIPQESKSDLETKGPETESAKPAGNYSEIIPENTSLIPGDLFIVAKIPLEQIRVMTVEQLREMFRCGHA